jgi:hypothetical protein
MTETAFLKSLKEAQSFMKEEVKNAVKKVRLTGSGWGRALYCFGDLDGWLEVKADESGNIVEVGILRLQHYESKQFVADVFQGGLTPVIDYSCITE